MKSFISQLNIRQLLIYFIATWFFIYATHTLTTLFDFSFLYKQFALQNRMIFKERTNNDMFIIKLGGYIGLIAAYIISWRISEKQRWFWVNSVVVLLVAFVLYYFDKMGWKSVYGIFLSPGHVFADDKDFNSIASIVTDGVLMLLVGLFLFFNNAITRFIDRGVKRAPISSRSKTAKTSGARA